MKKIIKLSFLYIFFIYLINGFPQSSFMTPPSSSLIVFTASLNAMQESPNDTSAGTATMFATLSGDRTMLNYQITFTNLTSNITGAHFHLGAPGVSGGVVEPITTFNGNTSVGVWNNIPDSLVGELLKGNIYVNIHTTKYPGGEIRGQLTPVNGIGFLINLNAMQVTTADTSKATGTGWAVLKDSSGFPLLTFGITVAGLTSSFTGAHFHIGVAGVSGGVVFPITNDFSNNSINGEWSGMSDSDLLSLVKDGLYVNIHTSNYPGGEIRGQVNLSQPISFYSMLNGSKETPSVTTNASGTGWFILDVDSSSLAFHITYANLQGGFTGSHIHLGAEGIGGGVVFPITTSYIGNTGSGKWTNIPDSLVADLIKGDLYVNIHSSAHPGGEIRGQLNLNSGIALIASLSGNQDVPPIITAGSGTAVMSFMNDTLYYEITVAGLSSSLTMAHFHLSPYGSNGGVVEPISFTDSTTQSSWVNIPDTLLSKLVKEDVYINVHTSNYPGGEIRGQVLASDYNNTIITGISNKDQSSSIPSSFKLSQNYPNPFNPSTIINFSVPFTSHVSLNVYDILGRKIAALINEVKPAGNYKVFFNGSGLSSGVYFYRLQAGNYSAVKKLILLK